jgi:FSR family fosmidomycin resistance protein-like MFS transporter
VAALSFGHGANDLYMGFLPALLPAIIATLGLDYKGAGALVSTVTLTSQLSQPALGFLGDRMSRRNLAVIAPALTAAAMSCLGWVHSYRSLVVLLIIGSMASSLFHPHGAALVNMVARARGSVAMSLFTAGGNIGFGLGSLLAAAVVSHLGFGSIWITVPVGFGAAAFLVSAIPRAAERHDRARHATMGAPPSRWRVWLVVLFLVVMLRAATATAFTTFVPVLMERRGEALLLGGWAIFGFSIAGAVGGFLAGRWSEAVGRRAITVAGFLLTAPAFYLFLHSSGALSALLLFLTGACLFSALPINIVTGQELVPRHASTVSGIIMGAAWGIGGLGATALGAIADHWAVGLGDVTGLTRALELAPLAALAAAALSLALPDRAPTATESR